MLALLALFVLLTPHVGLQPKSVRAMPTLSGALPLYPANHTFDAAPQVIGVPPANHDFEAGSFSVGTPPTNYDLSATAIDENAPTNGDFGTADFSNWTVVGSPQIGSDSMSFARSRPAW